LRTSSERSSLSARSKKSSLLPLFLFLGIAFLKSALAPGLTFGKFSAYESFVIFWNDLPLLGLELVLVALSATASNYVRIFFRAAASLLSIFYLIDTMVVLVLFNRVGLTELLQYVGSLWGLPEGEFLIVGCVLLFCLQLISRIGLYRFNFRVLLLGGALLLFTRTRNVPAHLQPLASPVSFAVGSIWGRTATPFSEVELAALETQATEIVPAWKTQPDIIFLIVESLSSADSKKTSGLGNLLPRFDSWAEQGKLFTEVFANFTNTEGGLVALFSGLPPIQYAGANWDLYRSHDNLSVLKGNLPTEYKKIFLATSDLSFRQEEQFLKTIGFDEVVDFRAVPRFQRANKIVFNAPPDEVLYAEALERIKTLPRPFFLSLETTSSHRPYTNPENGPHTREAIWEYVDRQMGNFFEELKRANFYEHGILIVVGDHRRMEPVTDAERIRYGHCAEFRVPLLLLGKGVSGGILDTRILQQSDIIRMFPALLEGAAPLTSFPILVGKYAKPLFGDAPAPVSIVYDENGALQCSSGALFGSELLGLSGAPAEGLQYLKSLSARLQRAQETALEQKQ